ncbi:MAG TPA: hypothetical protein VF103_18485, partial [Polyangiaceae bacterium]
MKTFDASDCATMAVGGGEADQTTRPDPFSGSGGGRAGERAGGASGGRTHSPMTVVVNLDLAWDMNPPGRPQAGHYYENLDRAE